MTFNQSFAVKALRVLTLAVTTVSLFLTGIVPAYAATATPLFLSFENNDPLRNVAVQDGSFGGARSELVVSTNTADGKPSTVLSFTKGFETWSGALLHNSAASPARLLDATRHTISLDIYSRDYLPSPLSIKVEDSRNNSAQKVLQVVPGQNHLTFDMATGSGWNPDIAYSSLIIFPNFDIGDGSYTGASAIPFASQSYEIDNVSIAGGTVSNLGTPFAKANPTLLTFESDDTLGKLAVGSSSGEKPAGSFEGAITSIENSPVGGAGGSALKIEKPGGAQPWAGLVLLKFDKATTRITSTTQPKVSFNYFSPVANSPTRVELQQGERKAGKTVSVPKGWSQVTIDFSQVEGWSADEEYSTLVVFPDFMNPATYTNSYYLDNFSMNGARCPIVRSAPEIVVNFEQEDNSGYFLTDFGGNTSTIVSDPPTDRVNRPNQALKVVKSGETWAGTTLITSGPGISLLSGDKPVVKMNIYSPIAGKTIMLRMDNSAFFSQGNQRDATVTSVVGWKTYTFEFSNSATTADINMATIFLDFGNGQTAGNWFLDEIRFNGADSTRGADVASALFSARLADWNSSNSYDGTKSWLWKTSVAQGWIDAKTGYFAKYVQVGSTFQLRYKVINEITGENAADGTAVTFRLGAASTGSNARFSTGYAIVDGVIRNGSTGELDQANVTTTVYGGYATLTLTSNDQLQDATENPGSSTANPEELDPRFMQVRVAIEGVSIPRQDWVSLVVTKPSAAPSITNLSSRSAKSGEAFDIVGSNLGDALGQKVFLTTPGTYSLPEKRTPVQVLNVNSNGTRMTLLSPSVSQEGLLVVTNSGGSAYSALFSASSKLTAKPTLVMPVSLVREVNSSISLSGKNLGSVSSVRIGNVTATFKVTSASSIVVTVPKGVVSGAKISVTNLGGTVTSKSRVHQAPIITYVTASARAGETIVINGSNLRATSVVFAGNQPAKSFLSANGYISVVVPKGALSGRIKITTAAGVYQTPVFAVIPPSPKIASFSQTSNSRGQTVVTVRGYNLQGATVAVGSVAVYALLENTSTLVKFIVPVGTDCAKIIVSTTGGVTESAKTLHLD